MSMGINNVFKNNAEKEGRGGTRPSRNWTKPAVFTDGGTASTPSAGVLHEAPLLNRTLFLHVDENPPRHQGVNPTNNLASHRQGIYLAHPRSIICAPCQFSLICRLPHVMMPALVTRPLRTPRLNRNTSPMKG